jgi:hypothetical protein
MKVTPESDVPTIPNATKNQGADLLAWKKLWLLALREVRTEMIKRTAKYNSRTPSMTSGDIARRWATKDIERCG